MSGRTHPPSLLRAVERALREECGVRRGDRLVCACSGGPDSSALLHALARLRGAMGHEVTAVGVDHGLRPEAAGELDLAERIAASSGVSFLRVSLRVNPGGNLQERARSARLRALSEAARDLGARAIATGHTADDRAETFLLRLLRGAGPVGLAVLPPRARGPFGVDLIRPLLRVRRAEVLAHAARHELPWAEDPSNRDPRYARVRVRREVLPLLSELSPGVVDHLGALADMLAARVDADDVELSGLGRAQRQAIERARRMGKRSIELRTRGGRDVLVTFPQGRIVLTGRK